MAKKNNKKRPGGGQRRANAGSPTAAQPKPKASGSPKGVTAPKGAPTASRRSASSKQTRDRASWLVLYAGIGVVLIVIGLAVWSAIQDSQAGTADADDWELPALNGGDDVALSDFDGKPVVLNFFASWCTACDAELPEYNRAADLYGDQVEFVFINSQDDGAGNAMARRHGIDDNTLVRDFGANDAAMFRALGGRGMPITAFYDADGSLRFVSPGALVNGALEEALAQFGYI